MLLKLLPNRPYLNIETEQVQIFLCGKYFTDLPVHQINSAQSHSTQIYSSSKSQQLQVTREYNVPKGKTSPIHFDYEVRNFKTRLTEQSLPSCHAKSTFKSCKVNILDTLPHLSVYQLKCHSLSERDMSRFARCCENYNFC